MTAPTKTEIEFTPPGFNLDELLKVQKKSWDLLDEIAFEIEPGITEAEGVRLITQKLKDYGVEKSWHHPKFRIGENTVLPFSAPASETRVLTEDDLYFIDLGPVFTGDDGIEYEGDVGKTYSISGAPDHQKLIDASQDLFWMAGEKWRNANASGQQIYQALTELAKVVFGVDLKPEGDGHRVGVFPHKPVFSGSLASIDFKPASGLWVVEIHVVDPTLNIGAFYEDILR
jgi:Xaa-Pro aminopeptidase